MWRFLFDNQTNASSKNIFVFTKDKYHAKALTLISLHSRSLKPEIKFLLFLVSFSFYFLHLVINYYEICAISIGRSLRNKKKFSIFFFVSHKFYWAFKTLISCTSRTLVRFRLILFYVYFHKSRMLQNGALSIRHKLFISQNNLWFKKSCSTCKFYKF